MKILWLRISRASKTAWIQGNSSPMKSLPNLSFAASNLRIVEKRVGYWLDFRERIPKLWHCRMLGSNRKPQAFLFLIGPDEVAIQRVVGRRTDPVTGKSYHVEFKPPPNDDNLRQRLIVRSDDTMESMERRLKHYRDNANAVKTFYTDVTKEINGLESPDDVSIKLDQAMKELSRPFISEKSSLCQIV
ncbi:hypothetical protein ACHAXS_002855 [Conticribra weissflogii]